MKNLIITSVTAGALAAAALGMTATATAAPAGPGSVDATINELRAQGFDVIVNRTGTAPHEQCIVSAVRPGQTFSRSDTGSGLPGSAFDIVTTVTGKTVYVDITC
jgi:NADPH:quinone reductase-like Zn-dependent oxidoreductase